jgi:K+-transporting ATPase ATPase C chain
MKKNLLIAVWMTVATTVLFGLIYPLVVTGLAQVLFQHKANGQLIEQNGAAVGSTIIGQGFSSPGYFHSRPSAAGNGLGRG